MKSEHEMKTSPFDSAYGGEGWSPKTHNFYESLGIRWHLVQVDELAKAAGGIGCLSGIVERKMI